MANFSAIKSGSAFIQRCPEVGDIPTKVNKTLRNSLPVNSGSARQQQSRGRGRLRSKSWVLSADRVRQFRQPIVGHKSPLLLSGRFLWRSGVRKRESVDQEFFVLFSVGVRPFLQCLLPRKLAAFFTFEPLVLPDLFFDKVADTVERIRIHYRRDLNVFFGL